MKPNPTLEEVEHLLSQVPTNTTEIISQGGGSTIDAGKWIARELNLKHTVIPTTAGTGSEVTKYCVLTIDGKKTTITDERFIPDSYILDPSLVVSLPPLQTIASGFDALSQSFESMWSKDATKESRKYSKIAIHLILKNLEQCIKDPTDEQARMNMLLAANFSGRAINIAPTNICHAISYPLTDWYNIPHGIACALTLPYFTKSILNINLNKFTKHFTIPLYEIDIEKVAEEAIKNPKAKGYTKSDIVSSLRQGLDTWAH